MVFAVKQRAQVALQDKVKVVQATEKDVPKIVAMINEEGARSGALLHVTNDEVKGWVKEGFSFVVKNESGEIVGHNAGSTWAESKWIEIRGEVLLQDYRHRGIVEDLTQALFDAIAANRPNATIVAIKNDVSLGRGLLDRIGFQMIPNSEAPKELFTIGNPGDKRDIYIYTLPSEKVIVPKKVLMGLERA